MSSPDADPRRRFRGWLRNPGTIPVPVVLALALAVVLLVALGVASATSTAAFGVYNPDWDGTSDVRDAIADDPAVDLVVAQDTSQYDEHPATETVAFVVAPDEPYEGSDATRLQEFVADGGTLVVFENFGTPGDDVLASVGADARTDGRLLLDERSNVRGPAMPVATGVTPHSLTTDVEQLTLNHATAIEPGTATVLVASGDYAYLGTDPAAEPSPDDELRSYPVVTAEPVGNGTVVAVGDPSITINAMHGEPDNAQFLANLYADADRVLLDLSHSDTLPPLTAAMMTLRASPLLQLLVGLGSVAAALGLARQPIRPALGRLRARFAPRSRVTGPDGHAETTPRLSEAEMAAIVRRQHPDWDDERVADLIAALNQPGSKRDNDQ